MKKKSKKAKKKKQEKEDKDVISEVDKEFYEIQISDLTKKLVRLRAHASELEKENESVHCRMLELDEDRADVIAFLKRTLHKRVDENAELLSRIQALEQAREAEQSEFDRIITLKDKEFREMHEQLSSEIKLLNGKLNSLEEFRIQRDDLLNKFALQEKAFEDQETKHKKELYDIERKFIISKDQLKKDVEVKLLELSLDFQNATQMRVAATTQRVIRENVSMNNELAILISSWNDCVKKLEAFKKREKDLKLDLEIVTEESLSLSKSNKINKKVIDNLIEKHRLLSEQNKAAQQLVAAMEYLRHEKEKILNEKQSVEKERQIIEKQLKSSQKECSQLRNRFTQVFSRNQVLEDIILQGSYAVKEAFLIQQEPSKDESLNMNKREVLLKTLLDILEPDKVQQTSLPNTPRRSKEFSMMKCMKSDISPYGLGDLGLIPK